MPIVLKQQHTDHGQKEIEYQNNIKSVLNSLKEQSQTHLTNEQKHDIDSMVRKKQTTAYEIMLLNQKQYIAHQFTKLADKAVKNQAIHGIDLMNKKFLLNHQLCTNNNKSKILVKNLTVQGVNDYHDHVKSKLSQINYNFDHLKSKSSYRSQKMCKSYSLHQSKALPFNASTSVNASSFLSKKRTQEYAKNILQFKQPSYWLKNQQKSQKIKQFLDHHRKEQITRQKRFKQSMQKYQQKIQQQQRQKIESHKEAKSQIFKKGLQKTLQYKDRRQNLIQNHETNLEKIQQFLQKINPTNKRLYKILQQKYKQEENKKLEQYQQKLSRIRENHSPFDRQQLQQHIQKYEQYKEQLNEELKSKKQQMRQQLQQIGQELKNLFKSKRYDLIASKQSTSPHKRSLSEIIERKSKKKKFAQKVKQSFQPKVSQRKKQELQESIRLLELSEDKSKRKVFKKGQIQYEDKQDIDGRKLGLQYLSYLKKYLENKPRKQDRPNSSVLESSKVQKINYLRQYNPGVKLKPQVQQWKKVINDQSFEPKDKYTFLKQSVLTLQHKALQKQIEARNLKKSSQELQKEEQFDKLYLQSVEAKMAILNNLMLDRK